MFDFCVENREVFWSLAQNCLQLDKDESIVSTFLVFSVDKYAVITIQKSEQPCGMFQFWSAKVCTCTSIS